jgi:hypothetical protein
MERFQKTRHLTTHLKDFEDDFPVVLFYSRQIFEDKVEDDWMTRLNCI